MTEDGPARWSPTRLFALLGALAVLGVVVLVGLVWQVHSVIASRQDAECAFRNNGRQDLREAVVATRAGFIDLIDISDPERKNPKAIEYEQRVDKNFAEVIASFAPVPCDRPPSPEPP